VTFSGCIPGDNHLIFSSLHDKEKDISWTNFAY